MKETKCVSFELSLLNLHTLFYTLVPGREAWNLEPLGAAERTDIVNIKLVPGNAEAFTEGLNGRTVQESFRQDTEDKKEAITGIGDDHIREDGMGMPAAYADQPEDRDFLCDGFPMDKIDDAAAIVSMDMAVAGGTADRAGLPFGTEGSHIGLEQNF